MSSPPPPPPSVGSSLNRTQTPMRYNNLGASGLMVSELSFGCMTVQSVEQCYAIMRTAFATLGIEGVNAMWAGVQTAAVMMMTFLMCVAAYVGIYRFYRINQIVTLKHIPSSFGKNRVPIWPLTGTLVVSLDGLGKLQGAARGVVREFHGVPFAAPPQGAMRWRSPAAPSAWDGVRDATSFHASCAQPSGFSPTITNTSEDCLFVDFYAPSGASAAPVFVWIHGGGQRRATGVFFRVNSA